MGIIYYVAFRFGAVKDISRIDEEVDYYEDDYVEHVQKQLMARLIDSWCLQMDIHLLAIV